MSNVNPKSFGPILIEDLIDQIAHPTGKWADYNCLYKAWIEYSRMTTFVSSNIMPQNQKYQIIQMIYTIQKYFRFADKLKTQIQFGNSTTFRHFLKSTLTNVCLSIVF